MIVYHIAVVISTALLWGIIIVLIITFFPNQFKDILHPPHIHNTTFLASQTHFLTCGHSVTEAKKIGCHYDILSNHWTPSLCADDYSIQEYKSDDSWFPYADGNRTQALAIEELGDLEFYYTSMRDHIVHCAMLWRRQYRAFSEGWKYVDQILMDPKHTMHCSQFLMDMTEHGQDYRTMPIKVFVGKAGCHVRDV